MMVHVINHMVRRLTPVKIIPLPDPRGNSPSESMKVPNPRSPKARLLNAIVAASIAILASPLAGLAKDHVDLQFWDMIWGGPEYIDSGKALVAQFNQEHPDITVNYRSIPWSNWYQTFLTAIGSGTELSIFSRFFR